MSITIKLYIFSKRENSTKVPASNAGASFDCILKNPTSVIRPMVTLQASDLSGYNYAYIPSFNRYYFISDIISESNNIWNVALTCDVLASYKTDIGNSSQYVLRSSYTYDGDIVDDLYPIKAITNLEISGQGLMFMGADGSQPVTYIIGILNNTTTDKYGAVKYYVMDPTQLGNLMGFLLGNQIISNSDEVLDNVSSYATQFVTEIENGIVRALANPTQYIVESYAVPYKFPAAMIGAEETVKIGWWATDLTARPLRFARDFRITAGNLALGDHPQKSSRGAYLNTEPFTRYWIYFGVFGQVPIDTMRVLGASNIVYDIYGDIFGNVRLEYSTDVGGSILGSLSACVKCNFPIGQVSIDALGASQSMLAAITPLSVANATEGTNSIIAGTSGVISAARSLMPDVRISGSAGTMVQAYRNALLFTETHPVVDDDNADRGRPLCKTKILNTIPGYIRIADPDIDIMGTREENEKIKEYLASGFFYE